MDTIKEEDSKFFDSDLMHQQPESSMNLESARSKRLSNISRIRPKTFQHSDQYDMEKMMVEIELTYDPKFASNDETQIGEKGT